MTAAVIRFQRLHGLEATGSIDGETLAELNVPATGRASFGLYNTRDEVDSLAKALIKAQDIFA